MPNEVYVRLAARTVADIASFISHVTVDCHNAYELSEWWKPVLGYVDLEGDPNEPGHEECMIRDPESDQRLLFIEVPDPDLPAKRIHLDLRPQTGTRDEELERLVAHWRHRRRGPPREVRSRYWMGGAGRPRGQPVCILRSAAELEAATEA